MLVKQVNGPIFFSAEVSLAKNVHTGPIYSSNTAVNLVHSVAIPSPQHTHSYLSRSIHRSSGGSLVPTSRYNADVDLSTLDSSRSLVTSSRTDFKEDCLDGSGSNSSTSSGHLHWRHICEEPRPINICDAWKRHMKEHETSYPCLLCNPAADHASSTTDAPPVHHQRSVFGSQATFSPPVDPTQHSYPPRTSSLVSESDTNCNRLNPFQDQGDTPPPLNTFIEDSQVATHPHNMTMHHQRRGDPQPRLPPNRTNSLTDPQQQYQQRWSDDNPTNFTEPYQPLPEQDYLRGIGGWHIGYDFALGNTPTTAFAGELVDDHDSRSYYSEIADIDNFDLPTT